MRFSLLLPFLLLLCPILHAQSQQLQEQPSQQDSTSKNANDSIKSVPTTIAVNIGADGNYQKGNVNRVLAALRTDGSLKNQDVEFDVAASYIYGEQDNLPAENDGMATVNMLLFPHNTVGWLSFGTAEFSRLRQIDFRWQFGTGAKLTLLASNTHTLKLSGVALFDMTTFPDTTRRSYRFSLRLKGKHTIITDRLRFLHESFFQPSLISVADVRWRTSLILELPLGNGISIRTAFNDTYESIVQPGRKKNDAQWTLGFNIQLR